MYQKIIVMTPSQIISADVKKQKNANVNTDRMDLAQVVKFFRDNGYRGTAEFFASCIRDEVTVSGLIEAEFVKRHVMPQMFGVSRLLEALTKEVPVTRLSEYDPFERMIMHFDTAAQIGILLRNK